jgi:hypothetical protein
MRRAARGRDDDLQTSECSILRVCKHTSRCAVRGGNGDFVGNVERVQDYEVGFQNREIGVRAYVTPITGLGSTGVEREAVSFLKVSVIASAESESDEAGMSNL